MEEATHIPLTQHEMYSNRLHRAKQEAARHRATLEWLIRETASTGKYEKNTDALRMLETLGHAFFQEDTSGRFLSALDGAPNSESQGYLESLENTLEEVRIFLGHTHSATILPFKGEK